MTRKRQEPLNDYLHQPVRFVAPTAKPRSFVGLAGYTQAHSVRWLSVIFLQGYKKESLLLRLMESQSCSPAPGLQINNRHPC